MRAILHVDLDAFFASVEELDHPDWVGHPLVVGADPMGGHGRGVVATCNYPARAYGIRSAMPISEAWRRCPDARFVPPRFVRYEEMSAAVFQVLREACPLVEPASVDEAYLDVSDQVPDFAGAVALARGLQARIRDATRLSASFGVGTSKMVAKIASDVRKPFGLTAVPPGTEAEFLAPLPVRRIPGVGPKGEERLGQLGIATCGELARLAPERLQREFGSWGPRLALLARGVDDAPVETSWERKSLGGETTFQRDVDDPRVWAETLASLAREAADGLREERVAARTVTLKVRLMGFETYTRARTLPHPTADADVLRRVAGELLRERPPARAVRLLGLRVSGLVPRAAQADLSPWPAERLGEAPPWRPPQRRLDET